MPDFGPAELLRRRVAADPSRPLVTYYDDATGERVEFSARTLDNWVAKTANFLVDGLDAEPGERVVLALPPHWQTVVWLLACWSAGLVAVPVDRPAFAPDVEPAGAADAYLLAVSEQLLPQVPGDTPAREVTGLSLHSLGGPLRDRPPGVIDYADEVRGYGDLFVPPDGPVDPHDPALIMMNTTYTGTEVTEAAFHAVEKWGLDAQSRVLVDVGYTTLSGLSAGLLAPLAAGASVIIQRNLDKDRLDQRVSVEHVTAVAGVADWNDSAGAVRRLPLI